MIMNSSQKIDLELLAPAGGFEQLDAAINFGADAVYLGLDKFSMRAKAKNFTQEELFEAVQRAHNNGVLVYLTCNIQMHQDQLSTLKEYLEVAESAEVDALILGDIGSISLAKKYAPSVDIHISTQAAVANSESARVFYEMGAKRVVLAREMTMDEISEFTSKIPKGLSVEAFAHGAQCMAQSGRCLISSYLCDRSANQGECTQPCRWGYSVVEEKRPDTPFDIEEAGDLTYLFNAQDLCMIEHLRELEEAGVNSIKIEGRNKKAFYVATVIRAYRSVLDGGDVELAKGELTAISHRPYSCGFYFGNPRQSLDFDGYTQETLHAADVLRCEKIESSCFELTIRCRNKIVVGDILEALQPMEKVESIEILEISWDTQKGDCLPVEEASRTNNIYKIKCDREVLSNSFLRKRENRSTSRAKVL